MEPKVWLTTLWWASSALMARMVSLIMAPSWGEGGGGRGIILSYWYRDT